MRSLAEGENYGGRPLRIAPVADVPGPIQKNYFFFLAAFFVDFLAAFLVAFFFAAFFAILGITPSVASDGRSRRSGR